jgi:abortive infection bacteriophage resistance protein
MYHPLWKVNSHENPLFSQNTWFSSHKCVVRNPESAKKKVFISFCIILSYLVKSDTRVLFVRHMHDIGQTYVRDVRYDDAKDHAPVTRTADQPAPAAG